MKRLLEALMPKAPKGLAAKTGDWILFLVLAVILSLLFQQSDLYHTAGSSIGYLNGHILDFYDYDALHGIHPSYFPLTYLMFAIWMLPLKIIGLLPALPGMNIGVHIALYAKILPCIIFLITVFLVRDIAMKLGMGKNKASLVSLSYATMPMAFFSQFIFGQYDVFIVVCVLMGIRSYLEHKRLPFLIWFGISFCFKYTSFLIFVPLLLLEEKKPLIILRDVIISLLPLLFFFLLYSPSPMFRAYAFGIGGKGDSPQDNIFLTSLFTGFAIGDRKYTVALVPLFWALLSAYAYFTHPKTREEEMDLMLWVLTMSLGVFFGFSKFHPQWLLLVAPFWTLAAFRHKETNTFLLLELIFMFVMVGFFAHFIPNNVDQDMLNHGILRKTLGGNIGQEFAMQQQFGFLSVDLYLTIMTTILLVFGIFHHPKFLCSERTYTEKYVRGWMLVRFLLGISIFVIPAMRSYAAHFTSPYETYRLQGVTGYLYGIGEGKTVTQTFVSEGSSIRKIQFYVMPGDESKGGTLEVSIKNGRNEVLETRSYQTGGWFPNQLITMNMNLPTEVGELCHISFRMKTPIEHPNPGFALRAGPPLPGGDSAFSTTDGVRNKLSADLMIYQDGVKK